MDSSLNQQNNLDNINNTGVLLVSHGSSLPFAENTFTEIGEKFQKVMGIPTEVGYMKVAKPSLPRAIKNLTEESPNINRIIALPVFLAPGIHTKIDIPIILRVLGPFGG